MYFAFLLKVSALLAPSVVAICSHNTHHYDARAVEEAKFGYTGLQGPLNWYGLNKTANKACFIGRYQTPINLDPKIRTESAADYQLKYPYSRHVEFENLGTTVEVNGESINGTFAFTSTGKKYDLRQFHFHTPSEHRIEEEYFPLEVHFVHVAPDGETLVIGFLVEIASFSNPLLNSILTRVDQIPVNGDEVTIENVDFGSLRQSLISNPVYRYNGSLTTPGCAEGISWVVSQKPLTLDFRTFNRVKKVLKFNSRYTQNTPGEINLLENAALSHNT